MTCTSCRGGTDLHGGEEYTHTHTLSLYAAWKYATHSHHQDTHARKDVTHEHVQRQHPDALVAMRAMQHQ